MYESVVEWVIIGLLLINVIALNNWHRIMHIKIQKLADAINLIVVMQMVDKQVSKSSDKLDVENFCSSINNIIFPNHEQYFISKLI